MSLRFKKNKTTKHYQCTGVGITEVTKVMDDKIESNLVLTLSWFCFLTLKTVLRICHEEPYTTLMY